MTAKTDGIAFGAKGPRGAIRFRPLARAAACFTCILVVAGLAPASRPADPPPELFTAAGIRVILQQRVSSDGIVARLYLLGGARQVSPRTAGIEVMTLYSADYGTARYPGATTRMALARTGSSITYSARDDWTSASLRTIRSELDSAWVVFADRIVHPTLATESVDAVRTRMLSELLAEAADPDAIVAQVARRAGFAGHPYSNEPDGTDASLRAITADDAREYQHTQFVTSRMLLVVVGNTDRATIERLVKTTFGDLPAGAYAWTLPPPVQPRTTRLTIIPRKLETDYIVGVFPGPLVNDRDYGAFRVATGLLDAGINSSVRESGHLAYAASASMFDDAATAGVVYVSTTSPEAVVDQLLSQISKVAREGIPLAALPWFTSQYTIETLGDQESASGSAEALARALLYFGDFRATDAALKSMNSTGEDRIRNVAAHYLPAIQWVLVGDTARFRKFLR